MYGIAIAVSVGFLILFALSGREQAPPEAPSLLKPFYKAALYLYKGLYRRIPRLFASLQVERDLAGLHPEEEKEVLKSEYYAKKVAISMAILFAGTLFGAAAKYSAESGLILKEDGSIDRWGYQEGAREISIGAEYGQKQMDFQVEVEPKLLTGGEAEALFAALEGKLPEYILGKNESLQNVTADLCLKEKYEDFPISIQWESGNPGVLSDAGQVFPLEREEAVTISFRMVYGACEREGKILAVLKPPEPDPEEKLYLEMREMLKQSQNGSLEEDTWRLPSEWKGESIRWNQVVEDNSLLLWVAAMAVAVMVFLFLDKDLHGQMEKRKKIMRREYPEIVHKLVLFVGAGMTIRGAFQKIAGEYDAKRKESGRELPAYEEVLYTCRELYSGISESLCYEHFGKRTGLQEYIRLSTLLAQNLKRGSSTLLERLREEAEKSAEEKLQQSKKLGEEAGTKLLVPMMLMLAVVMAIIMIPAFSNM